MYMSASQTIVITVQVEWKFPLLDREIAAKRAARCKKKKTPKWNSFREQQASTREQELFGNLLKVTLMCLTFTGASFCNRVVGVFYGRHTSPLCGAPAVPLPHFGCVTPPDDGVTS